MTIANSTADPRNVAPISDSALWEGRPVPVRDSEHCPWVLNLFNYRTGVLYDLPKPCGSWDHRECAEDRVRKLLKRYRDKLEESGTVHFAAFPYDKKLVDRLDGRLQRRRGAGLLRVQRGPTSFIFASTDMGTGPWSELPATEALDMLRMALALPGVEALGTAERRKGRPVPLLVKTNRAVVESGVWKPRARSRCEYCPHLRKEHKRQANGCTIPDGPDLHGSCPCLWFPDERVMEGDIRAPEIAKLAARHLGLDAWKLSDGFGISRSGGFSVRQPEGVARAEWEQAIRWAANQLRKAHP